MNTAARMCKYADAADGALCAAPFAAMLERARCSAVLQLEPRGAREVKGLGLTETFCITLSASVPSPALIFRHLSIANNFAEAAAAGSRPPGRADLFSFTSVIARDAGGGDGGATERMAAGCGEAKAGLSAEVRRWLLDPRHRIGRVWLTFRDRAVEREYARGRDKERAARFAAGAALHLAAAVQQVCGVAFFEPRMGAATDLAGAPPAATGIDDERRFALAALGGYCAVAAAAAVALLALRRLRSGSVRSFTAPLVFMTMAHLGVSGACLYRLPGLWSWLATFPTEAALLSGWMGTLSFRGTTALAGAAISSFLFTVPALLALSPAQFLPAMVRLVVLAGGGAWLSRREDYMHRAEWRLCKLHKAELRALRERLFDLLPWSIASSLADDPSARPRGRRKAAVLQVRLGRRTRMRAAHFGSKAPCRSVAQQRPAVLPAVRSPTRCVLGAQLGAVPG